MRRAPVETVGTLSHIVPMHAEEKSVANSAREIEEHMGEYRPHRPMRPR